ncbi:MAG TPA: exosortase E/protease, VPEID-CTERM system [Steroidobacteraceae bacterium]|nr:exosortase E/protease, VPEID-CTERM system [Steroidobacteraceae bacterium]
MLTAAEKTFDLGARMSLAARAVLLALVLACEKLPLDFLVNVNAADHAQGLASFVLYTQHYWFRFIGALALSLLLFAYAKGDRAGWVSLSEAVSGASVRWPAVCLHVLAVLPLFPLSYYLYGRSDAPLPFPVIVGLWLMCAGVAIVALVAALAPWQAWWSAVRKLGTLWLYAAAAALVATSISRWSQHLWAPMAAITFDAVRHLLIPIIPGLQADPHTEILRSDSFAVQISDYCSGLEGMGMLLAFCGAWLLCFRKEYRFPRALLLFPAGIVLSFVLNAVRIAALMVIGNAGHPDIAAFGFHSQAGWIAFTLSAGLIAIGSLHSSWLSHTTAPAASKDRQHLVPTPMIEPTGLAEAGQAPNPTAVYLMPLLAALAAGMIARANSNGFETLYWLRPLAATAALFWAWRWLGGLDWRFTWRGPLAGVLAFLVWISLARLLGHSRGSMPAALASMPPSSRNAWLVVRAAAFVTTVPLTQELAFRGYLMRRIAGADFDKLRFRAVGATALIVSAAIFGVDQGALWLPAALAGSLYGVLLIRTERIGEVLVAHCLTNALLALAVLSIGQWSLWFVS